MKHNNKVGLYSRVDYPVTVTYDGEDFILPPKSRTKREFMQDKIGDIDPKEVQIIR